MTRTREEILEERRRLKEEYGRLYDDLEGLLFRHDPIGINFGSNTDEYGPEVRTILPRLKLCKSIDEVQDVVYEEFVRWFGDAGTRDKYQVIAAEIWQVWQQSHPK